MPALVLPGDAPFVNDKPQLVLNALSANDAGTLALRGLMGTKGMPYGPLPIWIYQVLLIVTRHPVTLVVLHATLMASAIALALYWVWRTTGLWSWFAFVLVASPYLWAYERALWDNSFNLMFTALALASYAAFLARGSRLASRRLDPVRSGPRRPRASCRVQRSTTARRDGAGSLLR